MTSQNREIKISKEDHQKLEAASTKSVETVLPWAHQLAAGRVDDQLYQGYIQTEEYRQLRNKLAAGIGGVIVVFGTQVVGKTAALRHLYYDLNPQKHSQLNDVTSLLINWGDKREQIWARLDAGNRFFAYHQGHPYECSLELLGTYRRQLLAELNEEHFLPIKLPNGKELPTDPKDLDIEWAEKQLGKAKCEELREVVWFYYIATRKAILIDLPDYAKTDKRILNRHLSEISQLSTRLAMRAIPSSILASSTVLANRRKRFVSFLPKSMPGVAATFASLSSL
jgi:hypothetical protein